MENCLAVSCRIRVRYDEHGNTGYAFNGNYPIWMRQAARDLFDAAGLEDSRFSLTSQGFSAVNMDSNLKNPVEIDDEIEVQVFIQEIGVSSIRIQYVIYRNKIKLAIGHTEHAYVDAESRMVMPIAEDDKCRLCCTAPISS